MSLGVLEEIRDLREVWPNEAHDFTPWLAENIGILGKELGVDIDLEETESSVGDFNVDIFATDANSGRRIIIENQLEDTDHDHLGKLITYASGKDAELVVWVVRHAREEHCAAIEWLNSHTDEGIGFVLCEIKVYRIGNSEPAPKFIVIEQPNDWAKEMKKPVKSVVKKKYPNIDKMLEWCIVKAGDIIVAKGSNYEAKLLDNGHVNADGIELSLHKWLQGITGWSSVETYNYAIHKETGKTLSQLRMEYLESQESSLG